MKKRLFLLATFVAFLFTGLSAQQVNQWEFASDLEGWGPSGVAAYDGYTAEWDAGHMKLTHDAEVGTYTLPINAVGAVNLWKVDTMNFVHISMKNSTDDGAAAVWFATAANFSDAKSVGFAISTQDTEFKNYWVDMSADADWVPAKENLYLGFQAAGDPATTGVTEVDFIRFHEVTAAVVGTPHNVDGMFLGTTWQMAATIIIDDVAVAAVDWSVDDPSVATIDANGLLTAVAEGTVTVIATDPATGLTATKIVPVTPQKNAWEFNTDGDIEGWTDFWGCTVEAVGGNLVLTITGDAAAQTWMPKGWLPGDLEFCHIRMKNETNASGDGWLVAWIFDGDPGNAHYITPATTNDGQWVDVIVDLKTLAQWQPDEEIFVHRIDPVKAATSGTVSIDFIRFLEESPIDPTEIVVSAPAVGTWAHTHIFGLGNTMQMTASAVPANGNRSVVWTVDNTSVATVDANGLLTAVAEGAVEVIATSTVDALIADTVVIGIAAEQKNRWDFDTDGDLEGWTDAANCTVEAVGGNAVVTITAADPMFQNWLPRPWIPGDLEYLHLRMKNETDTDLGEFIGWISDGTPGNAHIQYPITANNTDFVDVYVDLAAHAAWRPDEQMFVLRVDPSQAATTGTVSYDYIELLEESPIVPTSYSIAGEAGLSAIYGLGNTLQMLLSYEPEVANRDAIWSVDDEAIATIDQNGLLTSVALGDVTVTATSSLDGNVSGTAVITVGEALSVTGVEVIGDNSTIRAIGGTLQLHAIVAPVGAGDKSVTWSVDNAAIATIDANGLLTSVAEGTVVATATSVDQPTISGTISILVSSAQINAWEFNGNFEGWGAPGSPGGTNQIDESVADGAFVLDIIGGDPHIHSQIYEPWLVGDIKYMHVRVKNESNNPFGEFFMWRSDNSIQTVRWPLDTLQTEFTDIYIDMYDDASWSGDEGFALGWDAAVTYQFFRIDPITAPGTNGTDRVSYDFIRFIEDAPALESVTVSSEGDKTTIGDGTTLQMISTPWPNISDGAVTWSTSDDAIATIDATTGVLTAVAAGDVTVTATSTENGAITGTMVITVIANVAVTAIDVTSDADAIFDKTGATMQMTATVEPADATNMDYTWSVSDELIATIDQDGLLTILKDGVVTVTATAEDGSGVTGTKDITVTIKILVMRLAIGSDANEIRGLGNTMQMIATVTPANASDLTVTWSVDDEAIATIDAAGMLTAVAAGTVNVTAAANDESGVTKTKAIDIIDNTAVGTVSANQLKLYPNPAGSTLYIDNASQIERVAIIDMTGQLIKQISNNSGAKLRIDTEAFASGLYLIRATSIEGDVITRTFIKK
ncbi:MAG: Ig-like domain-containing protein [Bacteroidota bacterium]